MKLILKIRDLIRWCIRSLCAGLLEDISRVQQYNLSTFAMHQRAFPQFKNVNAGKEVVVVACGPTAKDYTPIEGAVHIGVNHAIYLKTVKLDYLFLMDAFKARKDNEMPDYNNYRKGECVKFYGITSFPMNATTYVPSESDAIKAGAYRYRTDNLVAMRIENNGKFLYDISTQPLTDCGSVVFSAIQFALWTNPKRLYLVGCDCSNLGHFNDSKANTDLDADYLKQGYQQFKEFAAAYYPETEIVSINPVGLKGLFTDLVQS